MNATTLILLLLLLACPVSMFFMHRGGGHAHGSHDDPQPGVASSDAEPGAGKAPRQAHGGCGHAGHGGGSRDDHKKSGTPA